MSMGEINLAKGLIWSAKERRIIYRWMLVYLLVALILLPVVAYRASVNVHDGIRCGRQVQVIQKRFRQQHPDQSGMLAYADTLRDTLQQNAEQVAAISRAIPHTTHSMLPLLEMLLYQRDSSFINRLAFVQEDKDKRTALEFSLVLPANRVRSGEKFPALLQDWRNDPMLIRQFTAIVPVVTERGNILNKDVLIMKYRGILKEQ